MIAAGLDRVLGVDPRNSWVSLDQADRDSAFNVNAAVSDSALRIEKFNRESAVYRLSRHAYLNVPYASDSDRTVFDLFPASESGSPCLIFIHGGWWQRNSRQSFACYAAGLAASGWSVALPGYTLAPDATLTDIVREIGQAVDWLAHNGAKYGIAGSLVIGGWSAGAHLAAIHLDHRSVVAGLAIAGLYDLEHFSTTSLNQAVRLTGTEIASLSPMRRPVVKKNLCVVVGTAELPVLMHDARRFHQKREAAAAPGALLAVPEADHFSILDELQRRDGVLVTAAIDLLRQHPS